MSKIQEGTTEEKSEAIMRMAEMIMELKAELSQQRFNNKHNLSIDQKVTDEMERLRAENKELRESVKSKLLLLKALEHHGIDEEMWRIDDILKELEE